MDCGDCKKFVYNDKWERVKRGQEFVLRPPGTKTPCHSCPKKSPQVAKEITLNYRNKLLIARYWQVKATAGACLTEAERQDSWLNHMLALVEKEYRDYEAYQQKKNLIDILQASKGV